MLSAGHWHPSRPFLGAVVMPVYPYNTLATSEWLLNPSRRTNKALREELLWLHDVKRGPRLKQLQAHARLFVAWASSRFPAEPAEGLLACATVSPDHLRRALKRVANALLALAPPLSLSDSKKAENGYLQEHVIPMSGLLNGLMCLDPILHMGDDSGIYVDPDDGEDDTVIDPFTAAYVRFASPESGRAIRSALKRLRASAKTDGARRKVGPIAHSAAARMQHRDAISRRAWHAASEEAMRMAVESLNKFVVQKRFDVAVPGTSSAQRKFVAACTRLLHMARNGKPHKPWRWARAAALLQVRAEVWLTNDIRHHVKGNKQTPARITLKRRLGFVAQYAALMEGSWQMPAVVTKIEYLKDICYAIAGIDAGYRQGDDTRATQGPDYRRFAEELAALDGLVLRDGVREQWCEILRKEDLEPLGQFITDVVTPANARQVQSGPWNQSDRIETFRKISRRAKSNKSEGSFEDVFLNNCLVPLQRVGLAAQIPADLWRRANELEAAERAGSDVRKVRPLKTYISNKWILNPLGTTLALGAER